MDKKVILITGCSSGFGFETAKLLSAKGNQVYAGVRNKEDLSVFEGDNPKTILLDITWPQEKINEVFKGIIEKEKRLDVLVNNSGFGFLGIAASFSEEEVKEQFETNFFGQFKTIKAVLPYMRKQNNGLIINISSTAGLFTSAFYGIYSASKCALEALTASLRMEESLYGIKVVSVNPSSHETKFWENVKFPVSNVLLNRVIAKTILRLKHLRRNPMNVAKTIEKVIATKNPRKNYLVGPEAYALYYGLRIIPQWLIDFVAKRIIINLSQKEANV